jgi:hypothetical protein
MTKSFIDVTGADEEMAVLFCTGALERGLTWEHAVDYFYANQRQTDASIKFASLREAAKNGHTAACMKFLCVEDGSTNEELEFALYTAVVNKHRDVAMLLLAAGE